MSARKKSRKSLWRRFLRSATGKVCVAGLTVVITLSSLTLVYFYLHYARLADEKLASGAIGRTAMLFAAPERFMVGDEASATGIVTRLRRSGYTESRKNRMGWYHLRQDGVEIFPGRDSFFAGDDAVILFNRGKISQIISLRDNTERTIYHLEPALITNLFDRNREKRQIVRYSDLPKVLVNAVLAAEDKHFFHHAGVDPLRVLKTAYVNLREGHISQGASTLSMQVAGDLWLDRSKRVWRRKFAEVLITLHLERTLTKKQIFQLYANEIYLGNVGSFAIHGYGQAAQVYFNEDVHELTLPKAALLAGLPRGPNLYNPFRHPKRAKARRDWVLSQMLHNEMINEREYALAVESPLGIVHGVDKSGNAPYFVDLVNQWLRRQFSEYDFQSHGFRVYTTLDMDLQRAAEQAVRIGLKQVDARCRRLGRTKEKGWPKIQVAMVVLDPHTGAVKALIGGRNYSRSQLDRALAKRPPGSVFKPFVYAAALDTAVEGSNRILTPETRVMDEPTTFWYDGKPYEPRGYKGKYYGEVTLRRALSKSLNVPTVKVAEMVGYDKVVAMARRAGLNMNIQPTPAVALGSYEVTPLGMAGAYTMFANHGEVLKPHYIRMIRNQKGRTIYQHQPEIRPALDPRVAYLMVNILEETLRSGTAVRTRRMGFTLPAAGKTGTSHDGWFAGFTTELLCVVWVGYDDYRDIKMEGAQTALPIWTEFMKRAHTFRAYRKAKPFVVPEGVVTVQIDSATGKLYAPGCSGNPVQEVFVAGTQPLDLCNGATTQVAGWEVPSREPGAGAEPAKPNRRAVVKSSVPRQVRLPAQKQPKKKKGFWKKLFGIFR